MNSANLNRPRQDYLSANWERFLFLNWFHSVQYLISSRLDLIRSTWIRPKKPFTTGTQWYWMTWFKFSIVTSEEVWTSNQRRFSKTFLYLFPRTDKSQKDWRNNQLPTAATNKKQKREEKKKKKQQNQQQHSKITMASSLYYTTPKPWYCRHHRHFYPPSSVDTLTPVRIAMIRRWKGKRGSSFDFSPAS